MDELEPTTDDVVRAQRPPAQRQAPLRRPPLGMPASVESVVSAAMGAVREPAAASNDGAMGNGGATAHGDGAASGFVEQGVETAYTVIEAYLRRGRQAAQRLAGLGAAAGTWPAAGAPAAPWVQPAASAWSQGTANGWPPGGADGWPTGAGWGQTASSLAGPWMQLARAWADGLAALAPLASRIAGSGAAMAAASAASAASGASSPFAASAPFAGSAPYTGPATGAPAAAGPRARITIECQSPRLAEVELALEPGADLAALHADWSRAGQPAAAPGGCAFHSVPGHVRVRLSVADKAAPGRHEAIVSDGHGQTWGSLVVTLAS